MKNLKSILVIAIVTLFSNFASAQTAPVDDSGLAIGGYDVVSYFTANKATKGSSKFSATANGATYLFCIC